MKDYQFKYSVDEERRLIIFRVAGAIPSALLFDNFIATYQSLPEHWRYNRLVDYRRHTGLMDFADVEAFARRMDELNQAHGAPYKVAVVSNDAFEQARPATFRHLFPETVRTFCSMDDALDWLEGVEDAPGRQAG